MAERVEEGGGGLGDEPCCYCQLGGASRDYPPHHTSPLSASPPHVSRFLIFLQRFHWYSVVY